MSDYECIYLEPKTGPFDEQYGRQWCQDDVWDGFDYGGIDATKYIRNDIYEDLKALLLEEQTIRQSCHTQLMEAKRRIAALEFTIEKHNEDIHYSCQCNQNVGNCDGNGCKDCAKDFLIGEIGIFPQDAEIDIEPATETKRSCQNGRADICLAGSKDGVCCAENECDIDSGVRSA